MESGEKSEFPRRGFEPWIPDLEHIKCSMSSAAHLFERTRLILNIEYFLSFGNQSMAKKFKIRHVQIDDLPKT